MSEGTEVMKLVDALVGLPTPEPSLVGAALGIPLTRTGTQNRYDEYAGAFTRGAFSRVDTSYRPDAGFGMVRLEARGPSLSRHDLDLDRFPGPPRLDIQSPSVPNPTVSYWYELRGGALTVIFAFDHGSNRLRQVVLRWGSVQHRPGEEPIFATAPPFLYIPSYDSVSEVLEYAPGTRESRARSKEEVTALGKVLAHGYFSREGSQVAGYFATPEGPAFFHDKKRLLGIFGKVSGRIEPIGKTSRRRFLLSRVITFELVYEERHGVGANPYDTRVEDVDLFAFMVAKVRDEAFFRQLTRPWP